MSDHKDTSFFSAVSDVRGAYEAYMDMRPDDAEQLRTMYKADYDAAREGEGTVWGQFSNDPTKDDIAADYRQCITDRVIKAYVEQFSRDDFVSMLNLITCGMRKTAYLMSLHIADRVDVDLEDLVRYWNDTHPDEKKITFSRHDPGDLW